MIIFLTDVGKYGKIVVPSLLRQSGRQPPRLKFLARQKGQPWRRIGHQLSDCAQARAHKICFLVCIGREKGRAAAPIATEEAKAEATEPRDEK